jgi:hypothetical protein
LGVVASHLRSTAVQHLCATTIGFKALTFALTDLIWDEVFGIAVLPAWLQIPLTL